MDPLGDDPQRLARDLRTLCSPQFLASIFCIVLAIVLNGQLLCRPRETPTVICA